MSGQETLTKFEPQTNGFDFINSWALDPAEVTAVNGIFENAVIQGMGTLSLMFGARLVFFDVDGTLTKWADKAIPQNIGLCGGMAFAALDYFNAGVPIPHGQLPSEQPTNSTPQGQRLRNFLWQRMEDSLRLNVVQVFAWMAVLHMIPEFFPFDGGSPWLLRESRMEWVKLKKFIDAGQPRPLALIGTTTDPGENHQVLASGYEDGGDGTGIIYVYDMNCPGAARRIQVDFRGEALQTVEDCASAGRGPLMGFFCEQYTPAAPPLMSGFG